ncbi:MAG TPA: ABC transporter ATP-binding protein [Planctomycetota bacterium]|jgi:ABC-type multidrug transport system ATPase subunit
MIDVKDLTKIFYTHQGQEHKAVDGISFRVARGEIYGLLGPNGAGKTTTLRMLAGLMQPTSGEVCISGVSGHADPLALKQRAGFLTTNTGLYARLSPRETLRYFGELRGMQGPELEIQIEDLVGLLGLEQFANRRCEGLSSGEKQRVQIARTLMGNPPVLVLDEPTTGLDVIANRLVINFIRKAGGDGRTIVLSTHHLDEIEDVCQRFGIIHKGRLLAEGTLAELQEQAGRKRLSDIFFAIIEKADPAEAVDSGDSLASAGHLPVLVEGGTDSETTQSGRIALQAGATTSAEGVTHAAP